MTDSDKSDTDIRRDQQRAVLERDLSTAVKRDELARFYLEAGMSPQYVAHNYGVSLERCERFAAALARKRETA